MRVEQHFSAGGVVYRAADDGLEMVVCGRESPEMWGLPKGTPETNETPEQTALREVREETGLEVVLEEDLGWIEYWFNKPGIRVHKRVQFYLMSPTGGSMEQHDPEFDLVAWVPQGRAIETLTYSNEIDVLKRAIERVRNREAEDCHANEGGKSPLEGKTDLGCHQ